MTQKTISELLFELFCIDLNIPFTPIERTSQKTPDYDVILGGHTVVTEVKQCDPNEEDERHWANARSRGKGSAWGDSDRRIRLKIQASRKQLKARSHGKLPALLVVYDNGVFTGIDSTDIKTAMFGDEIVIATLIDNTVIDVNDIHPGGGRKLTENSNTSISAVALMYESGPDTSLSVFHNHFATNPIDPNWFRDDRFRHFALGNSPYEWGPV